MGFIGNTISSVLGGITGVKKEAAPVVAPVAVEEEVAAVTEEKDKTKKLRSALTATAGGLAGQEVLSTSKKSGLFGN